MATEHKTITDPEIHEPKGISTANVGEVYVAAGGSTGAWNKLPATSLDSTGENYGKLILADGAGSADWSQLVWKDLLGQIIVRGTGANDPAWAQITGSTAMWGHSFSPTTMQQFWTTFHIGHDYAPGTPVYLHVHWLNAAAVPNTGVVRWGFEYALAKGHQQQAFPMTATTTVYVNQTCNATRYMHHIAEMALIDAIPATSLEPDTLIHCRIFRDAADAADTCTDTVYGLMADAHYQADGFGTLNKAPNFNV